jgi:nitrogen fixation protein FixH
MTTTSLARDRHVPWIFVAGFAVVIAVNAIMVWLAVGSFSGLYTPQPRERSLHYNDIIARQTDRDALGWQLQATWQPQDSRLEIAIADAQGQPIGDARLHAELVRPVEKRPPVVVDMAAVDGGRYAATVDLPVRGNWDLDVVVEQGGHRFAQTRRMFLK